MTTAPLNPPPKPRATFASVSGRRQLIGQSIDAALECLKGYKVAVAYTDEMVLIVGSDNKVKQVL